MGSDSESEKSQHKDMDKEKERKKPLALAPIAWPLAGEKLCDTLKLVRKEKMSDPDAEIKVFDIENQIKVYDIENPDADGESPHQERLATAVQMVKQWKGMGVKFCFASSIAMATVFGFKIQTKPSPMFHLLAFAVLVCVFSMLWAKLTLILKLGRVSQILDCIAGFCFVMGVFVVIVIPDALYFRVFILTMYVLLSFANDSPGLRHVDCAQGQGPVGDSSENNNCSKV